MSCSAADRISTPEEVTEAVKEASFFAEALPGMKPCFSTRQYIDGGTLYSSLYRWFAGESRARVVSEANKTARELSRLLQYYSDLGGSLTHPWFGDLESAAKRFNLGLTVLMDSTYVDDTSTSSLLRASASEVAAALSIAACPAARRGPRTTGLVSAITNPNRSLKSYQKNAIHGFR